MASKCPIKVVRHLRGKRCPAYGLVSSRMNRGCLFFKYFIKILFLGEGGGGVALRALKVLFIWSTRNNTFISTALDAVSYSDFGEHQIDTLFCQETDVTWTPEQPSVFSPLLLPPACAIGWGGTIRTN